MGKLKFCLLQSCFNFFAVKLVSVEKLKSSGLNDNRKFSIMDPSCEIVHLNKIVYKMVPCHLKYQTIICIGSRFCMSCAHYFTLCILGECGTQGTAVTLSIEYFLPLQIWAYFFTIAGLKPKGRFWTFLVV